MDKKMKNKCAQQEMVGFVLIVVLVVVGLMIFLVISATKPKQNLENVEAENLLSSVLKYTTDCAIVYEPNYDSIRDLIGSCYENKNCENLGVSACEHLNFSLAEIMENLIETQSAVSAYKLEIVDENGEFISEQIKTLNYGNCYGAIYGAQELVLADNEKIFVKLEICS